MKKYILSSIAVLVGLIGCQKSELEQGRAENPQGIEVSFVSRMGDADSRLGITDNANGGFRSNWELSDKLGGWSSDVSGQAEFAEFSISELMDDGGKAAHFSGVSKGTKLRLVFPYDANKTAISSGVYGIDLSSQRATLGDKYGYLQEGVVLVGEEEFEVKSDKVLESPRMMLAASFMNSRFVFSGIEDGAEYRLVGVDFSGVGVSGDMDLSKAVDAADFIANTATGALELVIADAVSLAEGVEYELPVAVLPFVVEDGAEISAQLSFLKTIGDVSTIVKSEITKSNSTGGAIEFKRGQVNNVDFTCDLSAAVENTELIGSGSQRDPYQVYLNSQLRTLATEVNAGDDKEGVYYKMMNDIDLGGDASNQWLAIGSKDNQFKGHFDGGGFEVSGLYINNSSNY